MRDNGGAYIERTARFTEVMTLRRWLVVVLLMVLVAVGSVEAQERSNEERARAYAAKLYRENPDATAYRVLWCGERRCKIELDFCCEGEPPTGYGCWVMLDMRHKRVREHDALCEG